MDSSEIDGALDEYEDVSGLTDFEYSGSEYVPSSGHDSDSENESSCDSGEDMSEGEQRNVSDPVITRTSIGLPVQEKIIDDAYSNNIDLVSENNANNNDIAVQSAEIEMDNIDLVIEEVVRNYNIAVGPNAGEDVQHEIENESLWRECTVTVRQHPFTGEHGIQYEFDTSDPMTIYNQFLTDEILDTIVEETNRFAYQYLSTTVVKRRSMMREWIDCTRTEIKQLFGILMIMGICPLPKVRMYWSNNPMYKNEVIKKTMRRQRFEMLIKCLHFNNNENVDESEPRLSKIKQLVHMVNDRFKTVLIPEENIVVDETMIPWRGRLIFRQYNPQKAHKYGVKLYKLCTDSGYTYKMKVYAGKGDITGKAGHATKIILHLVTDLLGVGRTLYADNFYNSVLLAKTLLENKTYLCGTLRADRKGNPKDITGKKMKKGEVFAQENDNGVKVIKWVDKRRVLMVSTRAEDTGNLAVSGKRNRNGEPVLKPTAVLGYNKIKKGVDLSDQMSSYYTPLRKTTKWYKKVAVEILLGTCVVNAFVIFNANRIRKWEMLPFREELIKKLISPQNEVTVHDDQSLQPLPRIQRRGNQQIKHTLEKRDGLAHNSRKRCRSCYEDLVERIGTKEARKKAKRVNTFCANCPDEPSMCLHCFNKKHK